MRTDHVTAWLIKQWLQDHAPDLANAWDLQVDEQVISFSKRLETIIPQIRLIFVSQNILARTAIKLWDLKEVVLLAGGVPTPLSPRPHELRYYTDGNPAAVEEAQAAGYNARHVNVLDDTIQQIDGAKCAIATGLFPFLPDEATRGVFAALDRQGLQTVILSHASPEGDQEAINQYESLGIHMFLRDQDQLQALLPPGWKVDYCDRVVDYMRYAGEIGAQLADTPHMMNVLKVTKSS